MHLAALFPHWHGLRITHSCATDDHLTLTAQTTCRTALPSPLSSRPLSLQAPRRRSPLRRARCHPRHQRPSLLLPVP